MSQWEWTPPRTLGIWRHGAGWLRPVMASVPYVTICLLLMLMYLVSGAQTSLKGVLFDLPDGHFADGERTGLVAMAVVIDREPFVILDDSRFPLGDPASMQSFRDSLVECLERTRDKTLLVLADRRIQTGHLMGLVSVARDSGVSRVLMAGRRTEGE